MKKSKQEIIAYYFEKHKNEILKISTGVLRDPWLAEVVLQDTFEVVARRYDVFIRCDSPDKWIYRVMGNMLKRMQRERALTLARFYFSDENDPNEPSTVDSHSVYMEYQGLIPDHQLSMLIEFYCEHRSVEWLSAKYGMTKNNVRVTLHRARSRLRKVLQEELGYYDG